MKMRYFSSVQGKAFLRPGRPGIYLGCKRKPRGASGVSMGFIWNTEAVVAVSEAECNSNLRDWADALRDDVLIKKSEEDFKAAAKKLEADATKAAKAAKTKATKAAKAAAETNPTTDDEEG